MDQLQPESPIEVWLTWTQHSGLCSPALATLSSSPLVLLTQPTLATHRNTCNDLGVVQTVWPMELKERERKGPNVREKLVPEGLLCGAPAHSCSTVGTAVLRALAQRTVQEKEPRHCRGAASGA